jgi:plastocyanin
MGMMTDGRGMSTLLAMVLGLSLVVALPACKSGGSDKKDKAPTESEMDKQDSTKKSSAHQVTLYNYQFNPNKLTIDKGATVKFANKDPEKHNVKIAALDVDQNIKSGESWSYTFETSGEFAVENRLLDKPMTMTIVVGSSSDTSTATSGMSKEKTSGDASSDSKKKDGDKKDSTTKDMK